MIKKINNTPYLYDIDCSSFMNMIYKDALIFKYKAGKKLLTKILKNGYMEADITHMNDVIDAIDFNKQLLEEIGIKNV